MKVTLLRSRAIDPAIYKIADALFDSGYKVKLLVWDRAGNFRPAARYPVDRCLLRAPYDNFAIVMIYLPFWMGYQFLYLLKDDADIIQASDFDTLIPAVAVKLLKRVKVSYIIYDFMADNIPKKMPSLLRRIVAGAEKFFIGFTDELFLVDECRYPQVAGAKVKSLDYIYNSPPDQAVSVKTPGDKDCLTIFYAGVIHQARGLEYMIKALESLDNVRLIIAGTGPSQDLLNNLSGDLKSKVRYIGQLPYDQVIKSSQEADVLFAFYDPSLPNNRYASPNKMFEAMMCGKPIIVNSEVAAGNIVQQENCGVVVPYGDSQAIAARLTELKDKEYREKLGRNGRTAYEKKYGWNIMKSRLLGAYSKLSS